MIKEVLNRFKAKADKIKGFDEAISTLEASKIDSNEDLTAIELLELEMEKRANKDKIEALKDMQNNLKAKENLETLKTEYYENMAEVEKASKDILDKCEKAKDEYQNLLREYSKEHEKKVIEKAIALGNEYRDLAMELGFEYHVAASSFQVNYPEDPAEIIARETVYIRVI